MFFFFFYLVTSLYFMDLNDCLDFCSKAWTEGGAALEGLKEFVSVPNLSPAYDKEFISNGLIHKAIDVVKKWVESQGVQGLSTKVLGGTEREPLFFAEIQGTAPNAQPIIAYGHLDKMPHLDAAGWANGLSSTKAVVRGDQVYGRGTADDGYNVFSVITAVKYLQTHNIPHPKIYMVYETGEESGSDEIDKYLEELRPEIGDVSTILILDTNAQDYKTVWCCNSLRGVVNGTLSVSILKTPIHSGMGTGIVPDTFRIARKLLSRIENEDTGEILIPEAKCEIPERRIQQCQIIANHLGDKAVDIEAKLPDAHYVDENYANLLLNRSWKPGLAVTGADGIPSIANGSNVIRPATNLKLSLRIPPGVDSKKVAEAMKRILEEDPPYGTKVEYKCLSTGDGFYAPDYSEKIETALKTCSNAYYGYDPIYFGTGGSIPLCNCFHSLWPNSQLVVTGSAGPTSNTHSYNECLDIPYTQKFTAVLTNLVAQLAQ